MSGASILGGGDYEKFRGLKKSKRVSMGLFHTHAHEKSGHDATRRIGSRMLASVESLWFIVCALVVQRFRFCVYIWGWHEGCMHCSVPDRDMQYSGLYISSGRRRNPAPPRTPEYGHYALNPNPRIAIADIMPASPWPPNSPSNAAM